MKIEFHASLDGGEIRIGNKEALELNEHFRVILCGVLGITPDDTQTLWETYVHVGFNSFDERKGM